MFTIYNKISIAIGSMQINYIVNIVTFNCYVSDILIVILMTLYCYIPDMYTLFDCYIYSVDVNNEVNN